MRTRHFALLCAAALIAGCGGSNSKDAAKPGTAPSEKLRRELDAATKTSPKAFPAAEGRTLQEVADDLGASGPQVGLASSVFVPGRNRLAFGVIDRQTGFVSGPTAVYVARGPDHPARGPFPAPADLLITQPAFRSQTAASESDPFAAVYSAQVRLDRPGKWAVLTVTQVNGQLVGAGTQVSVVSKRKDSMPPAR